MNTANTAIKIAPLTEIIASELRDVSTITITISTSVPNSYQELIRLGDFSSVPAEIGQWWYQHYQPKLNHLIPPVDFTLVQAKGWSTNPAIIDTEFSILAISPASTDELLLLATVHRKSAEREWISSRGTEERISRGKVGERHPTLILDGGWRELAFLTDDQLPHQTFFLGRPTYVS